MPEPTPAVLLPQTSDVPDPPGRSGAPWWLLLVGLALLVTVVVLQRPESPDPTAQQRTAKGLGEIVAPHSGELVIFGKLMLAAKDLPEYPELFATVIDQTVGWEPEHKDFFKPRPASRANPPKKTDRPRPAADRLRATILAAEVVPREELGWRLDDIEGTLAPESPLRDDTRALRTLYQVPDADGNAPETSAGDLDPVTRRGFEERHGWFARLALSRNEADKSIRERAATDGLLIGVVLLVVTGIVALATLGGLVLLLLGAVNSSRLGLAFARPDPDREWPVQPFHAVDQHGFEIPGSLVRLRGGAVWFETVCIFLLGFLALKLFGMGLEAALGERRWLVWAQLGAQWLLASAILWPVVRGMPWERWRGEIGWHRGRGVLREIGAGLVAYFALVPVYLAMALIVVLVIFLIGAVTGGEPPIPEGNKVIEIVGSGRWAMIVLLFLLATIWAPVVEESIFRGALFRHLRRRTGVALAALASAATFAIIHPYPVFGWVMVGTLGFGFACMREWRSSLIASVTAHAVHNGFVLTILLIVLSLVSV